MGRRKSRRGVVRVVVLEGCHAMQDANVLCMQVVQCMWEGISENLSSL